MIQQTGEVSALRERIKFLTNEVKRLQKQVSEAPDLKEIRAKVWEQAAQDYHKTRVGTASFSNYCLNRAQAIREGKE